MVSRMTTTLRQVVRERTWAALIVAASLAVACVPPASAFSRECATDDECGLAALDPGSFCYTDALRLEDAETANAMADIGRIGCLWCISGCTEYFEAQCLDSECTLVELEDD